MLAKNINAFIYLSENVDTFAQGNQLGISNDRTSTCNTTVGTGQLGHAFTTGIINTTISSARSGERNLNNTC